jgi:multiple sugar transport system permease protein
MSLPAKVVKVAMSRKVKKRVAKVVGGLLRYTLIITLSFMIMYPLLRMLHSVFAHPRALGLVTSIWVPAMVSLDNLRLLIAVMDYWVSLPFTILMVGAVMLLQLANAALAGYAFARLRFKGIGILFVIVLITFVVPTRILMLPQGVLFRTFDPLWIFTIFGDGPINLFGRPITLFLMAGLGMGISSGLFIYIFRQFYRGLPKELEEAAYVDGAGILRTFFTIVLPMAKPAFLTVGVLSFIWNWNDTHFTGQFNSDLRYLSLRAANLATPQGGTTMIHQAIGATRHAGRLPSDILVLSSSMEYDAALLTVATFLSILPLIVLFFIIQKQFIQGVERSGIVG